jgi:integrase
MSTLRVALNDYLALRRSLGYKLERTGQVLTDFVDYAESTGTEHIQTDIALSFALLASNPDSQWRSARLGMVRSFARYLHGVDPSHEVPPTGLIPRGRGRPAPYLYSQDEVTALMSASRRLRSPLQAATLEAVIGLLAVSGLRVGEVIRLNNDDVDFCDAILTVRFSKGGKSRVVPIQESTVEALQFYLIVRDQWFPEARSESFFVSRAGQRLRSSSLGAAFARVSSLAGLPTRTGHNGPRLGDFRHSFAVQTLLRWHMDEIEVAPRLPTLSTYLGHVNPTSTYWYFSASPELLAAAVQRLTRYMEVDER